MNQEIKSEHWNDKNDNPAGGCTYGPGFAISWQNGPLGRGNDRREANGAFVEAIIMAAMDRIQYYQDGKFACSESAAALACLNEALYSLEKRTENREKREVEGTHEA